MLNANRHVPPSQLTEKGQALETGPVSFGSSLQSLQKGAIGVDRPFGIDEDT